MKQAIITIIFFFLILVPLRAQNDFKVIRVNGSILIRERNVSLETGTVFSEKEDLLFKTDDATAAVINAQKGRVVITSRNHDLSTIKSNYLPSMYNISSRGGSLSMSADLSNHFSGRYVVLERESTIIDRSTFPMDNDHFFFLRYRYKNEDINKKLSFSGDSLIIDKKSLFTVDGNPIPSADNTSIRLYYHKGNESVFIGEFDLIFPEMNQLAKETEVILSEIKGKTASEKINDVGAYINEFYGKVSYEQLKPWLDKKFGVK
ncbi:MAG TPA: hypothetical protein VMT63_01790 [Bacteroidales bacterium]|nr:hypothetical protein [Bacteroidales bacterium]